MRDVLTYAKVKPTVLQVEIHPYNSQEKLLRFCKEKDIAVTGFSSLGVSSYVEIGMGTVQESCLKEPCVEEIAAAHKKSPAQVVLRWSVQRGIAIIPKSSKAERLVENMALFDFELSEDQMKSISGLNKGKRFNDPGHFCQLAFNTFFPIYE